MDNKVTLAEIRKEYRVVREARGWHHEPRGLAISIAMEVAELMEHFQWENTKPNIAEIELEMADIFNYLFSFADSFNFDVSTAVRKKIKHLDEKYPMEKIINDKNEEFYFAQKKKYRSH